MQANKRVSQLQHNGMFSRGTYAYPGAYALTGWDKKATARPTSFMMITKFAGVIVLKLDHHRQLARPLSVVQQQYLTALDVPAAYFTDCTSG
jgi:hypothetical protein